MAEYTPEEVTAILDASTDRNELQAAAVDLALSDDPRDLEKLGQYLRRQDFLGRLDNLSEPTTKTLHLSRVLEPLVTRPSADTADLSLALSRDEAFMADPDRLIYLLRALAAVRPMSEEAAELFRHSNTLGYSSINAPLLGANASPRALSLFESMVARREEPIERRCDWLHMAVLHNRTQLSILQMCERLLAQNLEPEIHVGVIESVFDYQPRLWFGLHAPRPPAWRSATPEVLRFVLEWGVKVKSRPNLPERLTTAITNTVSTVRALLARRP